MNIQPIQNNDLAMGKGPNKPNPRSIKNRIKQYIVDAAPTNTFNDGENTLKNWIKFDEKMSRPAENRGVMGGTAILLQPAIDASNKRVDKETRQVSICRTIAKIIAGTGVGMLVRGSAYKMVENMTNPEAKDKCARKLLPSKYIEELSKNPKLMKNYRSALSTGIAIAAMCITNFALDAPLTVFLTNKFTAAAKLKEGQDEKRA